jgi:UDP-N-acetylglucosamine--N-acetylmuramyl-(pentapeptide) pyrophosphoryl-undecaprenol N-acetylglucosamine transferase
MKKSKKQILMTGGGTLGPVTPLMAIASTWQDQDEHISVSWIGTPKGPEKILVEEAGYTFFSLSAPKIDRHKKWKWVFVLPFFFYSLVRAFYLLKKIRPSIVFTAGGYVSVPVVFAAWVMRIPSWVHQLDVQPGIANRIMAPFAKRVSVTWQESMGAFSEGKTTVVGSLVRDQILRGNPAWVYEKFELDSLKPTILISGGGTGAESINKIMLAIGGDLIKKANIIHLTGRGKMIDELQEIGKGYAALEFVGADIADLYAAADIVVARAGMGNILELSALAKPTVLIPIPNSHQKFNAQALEDRSAAHVIWKLNAQVLRQELSKLVEDEETRRELSKHIKQVFVQRGEEGVIKEVQKLIS